MDIDKKIAVIRQLKDAAGSHSPSRAEMVGALGYDPVKYDFCFLSNPFATDLVVDRFETEFDRRKWFNIIESYPAGCEVVANRIASFEGSTSSKIIVGNGAIQCIEWACLGWGIDRLLVPTPTFSTYYEMLGDRAYLTPNIWLSKGDPVDSVAREAQRMNCDAILLILPNNPTGETLSVDQIESLLTRIGPRKVIIDESFAHFQHWYPEYRDWRNRCDNPSVVFIKSMSKDFGIAGLRLGYLTTSDDNLAAYARLRTTWNLNNLAVEFSALLVDDEFRSNYEVARTRYIETRDTFYQNLLGIEGIDVYKSQANFFLIGLPEHTPPDFVYSMLIESGIYVRTMGDKIGLSDRFIRVASRTDRENNLFVQELRARIA